jgi:hypothetical protein
MDIYLKKSDTKNQVLGFLITNPLNDYNNMTATDLIEFIGTNKYSFFIFRNQIFYRLHLLNPPSINPLKMEGSLAINLNLNQIEYCR